MNKLSLLKKHLSDAREGYSKLLYAQHQFIALAEETIAAMETVSPRQAAVAIRKMGLGDNASDKARAARIVALVADIAGIAPEELSARKRGREIDGLRSIAMLLIFDNTRLHHGEIGPYFKRDRSAISTALKTIRRRLLQDGKLLALHNKLNARILPEIIPGATAKAS